MNTNPSNHPTPKSPPHTGDTMTHIDTRTFYATNLPIESRDSRGNWNKDNLGIYNRDTFKGQRCYIHFNGGIFQIDKPTAAAMIQSLAMWLDDNPTPVEN